MKAHKLHIEDREANRHLAEIAKSAKIAADGIRKEMKKR